MTPHKGAAAKPPPPCGGAAEGRASCCHQHVIERCPGVVVGAREQECLTSCRRLVDGIFLRMRARGLFEEWLGFQAPMGILWPRCLAPWCFDTHGRRLQNKKCHEMALELVSWADFRWNPHSFVRRVRLRGSRGPVPVPKRLSNQNVL